MLDIGDIQRLQATFSNGAGAVDDPTTITLVVKNSGGTTTYTYALAEITRSGTGIYYKDITIDVAGNWFYRWTSTGDPTTSEEEIFSIRVREAP